MAARNGNTVLVYFLVGNVYAAVGGIKTNSIEHGTDLVEVSGPTTGKFKEYITGRKDWKITINYLVITDDGIRDILRVGQTFTLQFKPRNENVNMYGVQGNAIMKNCEITATRGNLIKGNFVFQGTGELS